MLARTVKIALGSSLFAFRSLCSRQSLFVLRRMATTEWRKAPCSVRFLANEALSASCYVSNMGRERSFPVELRGSSAITRRLFLEGLVSSFALSQFSRLAVAVPSPSYPFVEVPPSSSKITWVHNAGKSALKHLPEISGAGCAFLDYDNDGWMDIYLVNSGTADFY